MRTIRSELTILLEMMFKMDTEAINMLVESQLAIWPDAKRNYDALALTDRKRLRVGNLEAFVQHNPARIKSTGAKIDAASIKKRPCFLCKANRPAEQLCGEWIPSWELLVNPYPILPIHFTIVNTFHRPQDGIPLEMAVMAEKAPDLAIFYNGAKAGASAPDHRHCQAVLKSELPLLKLAEKHHLPGMPPIISSEKFGLDLPFNFLSAIVTPDREGGITLQTMTLVKGVDGQTGKPDSGLVNAFFWISDTGYLRIIVIPRKAHRPECYSAEDETQMTVSPGALDMAGIMIMPVRKDYDRMNPELAEKIYGEVAFKGSIPPEVLS